MKVTILIILTFFTRMLYSQSISGQFSINQKYYGYTINLNADSTFEASEIGTGHLFFLYYSKGTWTTKADTLTINVKKLGVGKKVELTDSLMKDVDHFDVFLIERDKLKLIVRNGQTVKNKTLKRQHPHPGGYRH